MVAVFAKVVNKRNYRIHRQQSRYDMGNQADYIPYTNPLKQLSVFADFSHR